MRHLRSRKKGNRVIKSVSCIKKLKKENPKKRLEQNHTLNPHLKLQSHIFELKGAAHYPWQWLEIREIATLTLTSPIDINMPNQKRIGSYNNIFFCFTHYQKTMFLKSNV